MKNERDEVFRIARTFDANINTIFDLWTEPKHLSKWLGPKGSKCTYLKSELKVGGASHYCMTGHDGSKMWGKVIYKEIVRPSRLTYIQCFSDENEGISQHPMAPDFPAQMLTTVTFEAEGEKTKISLTWAPYESNKKQTDFFISAKPGMAQGWSGSFDQLDAYLKDIS